MKKSHIYIFLALSALFGCTETELGETLPARSIVEAIMLEGKPIQLNVSKEILFKREESDSIFSLSGLAITINDGANDIVLVDEGDGLYTSEQRIDVSKVYTLRFDYNEDEITSQTDVPEKPESFESSETTLVIQQSSGFGPPTGTQSNVDLNWSNTDGSSFLVVVENLEADPSPISTTGNPRPTFRSEPITDDSYQIRGTQFQYYGEHAIILYKINAEYVALYEDPGDNSLTIKSPFTNVENGLGIFTAVNADTLYLNVTQ